MTSMDLNLFFFLSSRGRRRHRLPLRRLRHRLQLGHKTVHLVLVLLGVLSVVQHMTGAFPALDHRLALRLAPALGELAVRLHTAHYVVLGNEQQT